MLQTLLRLLHIHTTSWSLSCNKNGISTAYILARRDDDDFAGGGTLGDTLRRRGKATRSPA